MKNIKTLISTLILASVVFAGSISPVLSLRFNDISNAENGLPNPDTILGLKMDLGDNINAGFDSNNGDFRIYLERSFATFGMGNNAAGKPQFTVGANMSYLSNLTFNFDYVVNNLNDDEDQMRMGLSVSF
tara:strand:+ start:442 stop:831 length:390 start_codon:yes stop_codon:yes gene_type:complete